jgi:hypothetical protein
LEEDLDRLLQVGGEFGSSATSRRRTSQHPSKGSCPRQLLGLQQRRHTFTKRPPRLDGTSILVGQARALEWHESSKLPSLAHLFAPSTTTTCRHRSKKAGLSTPRRLLRYRQGTRRPAADYFDYTTTRERDSHHQ